MEVGFVNIVGIFLAAVAGTPHIADNIPSLHPTSNLQVRLVGVVFPQVSIVVIAFIVEGTNPNSPSSILIPSKGFYDAGFYGDDGRSNRYDKVYIGEKGENGKKGENPFRSVVDKVVAKRVCVVI